MDAIMEALKHKDILNVKNTLRKMKNVTKLRFRDNSICSLSSSISILFNKVRKMSISCDNLQP
jgi:hypothetical protein